MKPLKITLVKRLLLFGIGIFIMTLGVAFSVKSNLGVSPVTSVPYVMSRVFGLSLGLCTVLVYIFCMLLQAVILRREYRLINLFQIAASFMFGFFTDITIRLTSFLPVTDNYVFRTIYLLLGISCVALGILFYLTTNLIALPTDGTVQAIAYKGGFKLHKVKMAFDSTSTFIALVLSLTVLNSFQGLGVGTIVASLGVGKMLGIFTRLFKNKISNFLQLQSPDGCTSDDQDKPEKIEKAG